jgi:hypothetical protein
MAVTASASHGWPTATDVVSSPIGAGASLIALLHYLANHASDRLLISQRHRSDHRGELATGHVGAASFGQRKTRRREPAGWN